MMSCSCRTKSLRIFVQSLTELRVTDPSIPRSVGLNRLTSPIGFRQASVYRSTRSFGSVQTSYSLGHRRQDASLAGQSEEEPTSESAHTTAVPINNDLPTPTLLAPEIDLTAAKRDGAILDFNPESIEMLVANLDRASPDVLDLPAPSKPRAKPKAPVEKSQLKRLKIVKEKTKKPPEEVKADLPQWKIQKAALKEKFPEGWKPRKRLSPEAIDGIRDLHSRFPKLYTTPVLANHFEVSPEAIRRILRSKWTGTAKEEEERQKRWFDRGKAIWAQMAALGVKPPRKWRREGIVREPHWNEKKGPRTEYPYVPRREPLFPGPDQGRGKDQAPAESVQRKFSGTLL